MFKTLNIFGVTQLPVITIFLFLAVLGGAFVFWRKLREGAFDEFEMFDDFLLSLLAGFGAGRLIFILLHFETFSLSLLKWINFVAYPGLNLVAAIAMTGLVVFWRVGKRKVDEFEILDFWAVATSLGLFFYKLGEFFDGDNIGRLTNVPWGITFPGLILPAHPAMLYEAMFFLVVFFYLSWAEFHYRTFDWYRRGKNNAQAGFCVSVFLLLTGVFNVFSLIWRPPSMIVVGVSLDIYLYAVLTIFGGVMLWLRSGRKLFKKS